MIIEGKISGKNKKIAIIFSRFNDFVGQKLLDGAIDALIRHEVDSKDISVYKVPGALEISFVLNKLKDKDFDAIICLGVVIRGATPHFEYVSAQVSKGIASIGAIASMPVIFGVLTTDSIEQAVERAGTKSGNKGWDAAVHALEMSDLNKQI